MPYKISFILPIYKVERQLERCIKSVLNQDYDNIEVILVDDGSPDSCPAICDDFAKQDHRVKTIHKKMRAWDWQETQGCNMPLEIM